MPLLAFSFKPRNGVKQETVRTVCRQVFAAGFNIIEMDTRNLSTEDESWLAVFFDIAKEAVAADGDDHSLRRFSLNLSLPAIPALEIARKFKKLHPPDRPWVVKVDGGLDGLSTIQALRDEFRSGTKSEQPIITCYPILDELLSDRLGPDTFIDMLVLSGADIIYPGGAPRIGPGGAIRHERAESGYRRYWNILAKSRPMPSIAGGVHAGQLAVYHEFFGPDVAYFFGGGVATHVRGPSEGAKICRAVLETMAGLENEPEPSYDDLQLKYEMLREHYVAKGEAEAEGRFEFQNPKDFLKGSIKRYTERQRGP